jgi:hypothetical protein
VHRAPGFPCALCLREAEILAQLGRIAPRECGGVSGVIARSVSDEAIHSFFLPLYGLLRCARNDGDPGVMRLPYNCSALAMMELAV